MMQGECAVIVFGSPSRYVQGPGALAGLGRELARMGGNVALLVDPVMLQRYGETIRASAREFGLEVTFLTFGGEYTGPEIDRLQGGWPSPRQLSARSVAANASTPARRWRIGWARGW